MRIALFFVLMCSFSTFFPKPVTGQGLYEYKRPKEVQEKMLAELLKSVAHLPVESQPTSSIEFLRNNKAFPGYPLRGIVFVPVKNTYDDEYVISSTWQYDSAVNLPPTTINTFLERLSSPTYFCGCDAREPILGYYFLIGENGIVQSVQYDLNQYSPQWHSFYTRRPNDEFIEKDTEWYNQNVRNKHPKGVSKNTLLLIQNYIKYDPSYIGIGMDLYLNSDSVSALIIDTSGKVKKDEEKLGFNSYIQVFASKNPSKIDSLASFCERKFKQKCYVLSSVRKRHAYFRLIIKGKETEAQTRELLATIRKTFPDAFFGIIRLAK